MELLTIIKNYGIEGVSIAYIGDLKIDISVLKQYEIKINQSLNLKDVTLNQIKLVYVQDPNDEDNSRLISSGFNIIFNNGYKIYIRHSNEKIMCARIFGGLGNQIYEVLALIKYSRIHGYKPIFDRKHVSGLHSGDIIFDLYPELSEYISAEELKPNFVKYNEIETEYRDIPALGPIQLIEGYFQGEFYFDKIDAKNIFKNFIKLPEGVKPPEVTLHIRRGNAVGNNIFHVPEVEYYHNALKRIPKGDVTVVTEELIWAKENLSELLQSRNVKWMHGSITNDFKLLANATVGSITANSTYSWWAAYFNSRNITVVYPKMWFQPGFKNFKNKQYHSDGWIPVSENEDGGINIAELLQLRDKREWNLIISKVEKFDLKSNLTMANTYLNRIIDEYYMALFYTGNYDKCVEAIKYYQHGAINDHVIHNTTYILPHLRRNKKVIATLDPDRKPKSDEIIVIYGDYPWSFENLIINNPCFRHFKYFNQIHHDIVEYDKHWDLVDRIYIINLNSREDRYLGTVSELIKLGIPLNKVVKFAAIESKEWGCSASHLEVIKLAREYENVLIFEDDFHATSSIDTSKESIKKFLERKYDYDVCLLASHPMFNKNTEHDDLLYKIRSRVTTCAGYFISKQGISKLIPIWEDALNKLKINFYTSPGCDVTWELLQQDNKFFQFRTKLGYQSPQFHSGKSHFYMY